MDNHFLRHQLQHLQDQMTKTIQHHHYYLQHQVVIVDHFLRRQIKSIVNLFVQNASARKIMEHSTSAFVLELVFRLQDGAVYTKVTTNSTAAEQEVAQNHVQH